MVSHKEWSGKEQTARGESSRCRRIFTADASDPQYDSDNDTEASCGTRSASGERSMSLAAIRLAHAHEHTDQRGECGEEGDLFNGEARVQCATTWEHEQR
jgi:hypothetical protein